jgi:hypothetical protein
MRKTEEREKRKEERGFNLFSLTFPLSSFTTVFVCGVIS